jgi:hypothetical protein
VSVDAQFITSVVALIVSGIAFYVVIVVRGQILEAVGLVKHLVSTRNALTLGELGDATETRRIEALAPDDRTAAEREHMHDAPLPRTEQPGGSP